MQLLGQKSSSIAMVEMSAYASRVLENFQIKFFHRLGPFLVTHVEELDNSNLGLLPYI